MRRMICLVISVVILAPFVATGADKVFTDTDLKKYQYGIEEGTAPQEGAEGQQPQEGQQQEKAEPEEAGKKSDADMSQASFRELLAHYNAQIASAIEHFTAKREEYQQSMMLKSVRKNKALVSRYDKELQDLNDTIEVYRKQRQELKAKVVQAYGILPAWWQEPDLEGQGQ